MTLVVASSETPLLRDPRVCSVVMECSPMGRRSLGRTHNAMIVEVSPPLEDLEWPPWGALANKAMLRYLLLVPWSDDIPLWLSSENDLWPKPIYIYRLADEAALQSGTIAREFTSGWIRGELYPSLEMAKSDMEDVWQHLD